MQIQFKNFFRAKEVFFSTTILSALIFYLFCRGYKLFSLKAWNTPLGYRGDGLFDLSIAKGYIDGGFSFLHKQINLLGAPFGADWSAYPITEDIIFYCIGLIGKFTNLFFAANFVLFLAHLFAGLSFWFVCRHLKLDKCLSFSGSIAYAFCHYIVLRGFGHLILSFFWHIPILLLIVSWCYQGSFKSFKSSNFFFALIMSFIAGLFNPYYTFMYLFFLGFSVVINLILKKYIKALYPIFFIAISITAFLLVNLDSLISPDKDFHVLRNFAALEVYGLKLPELFLTATTTPWPFFSNFSYSHYYNVAFVKGELWSPYLGVLAIAGFFMLYAGSIYKLITNNLRRVHVFFWQINWIIIFSLIGGVNLIFGVFGFQLFRCSNRFSIFILTMSLLYLIEFLSKHAPKKIIPLISILIILIGYSEQYGFRYIPPPPVNPYELKIDSDKRMIQAIEKRKIDSQVFLFPIAVFPENGSINEMIDYEHLRLYLNSSHLKFSYGDFKGRKNAQWQSSLTNLEFPILINKIESYGFDVFVVNKLAYKDHGNNIKQKMKAAQKITIAENDTMIAFALNPPKQLRPLDLWPIFGKGWSADEMSHRWADSKDADITISNFNKASNKFALHFNITSISDRNIYITLNDKKIFFHLKSGETKFVEIKDISVGPGRDVKIRFHSDEEPVIPGSGDSRHLTFCIKNFLIKQ